MSQAERLGVMNRIGAKAASGTQRRYRLQPQCVLEVVSRHHGAPAHTSRLAFRGTDLGHVAHERRYKVRLSLTQAPQVAATVMFDSPLHTDAMLMKLLLVHVHESCVGPSKTGADARLQDLAQETSASAPPTLPAAASRGM